MNMKTYVLIISLSFPKTHKRSGDYTMFDWAIDKGVKVHTIRSNVELWSKRIKAVQAGEACLSIRTWSGKPYRSKQIELFNLDKSNGVGLSIVQPAGRNLVKVWELESDDIFLIPYHFLANNDGLSLMDFMGWFKNWGYGEEKAIIHFTSYRYKL